MIYNDSQRVKTDMQRVTTSQKTTCNDSQESQRVKNLTLTVNFHWLRRIYSLLRSHYRNYGEHKGLAVLNSELPNSACKFLSVTLRNFRQGIFPKILAIFQSLHFAFCWILAQTRESGNQSG